MDNNLNSSYIGLRYDLLRHISTDKNNLVLDVGCATGANGKFLLQEKMAREVYGIEYNSEMAQKARENGVKIIEGNLEDLNFRENLMENLPSFDYIIFGDVLEHLYSPEDVLSEMACNLKSGGKIIISLPNISHIELFIQVYIKGSWPLNERGIFDKTHIRWFTKKDALSLVTKCGMKVHTYEAKLRARDSLGSAFDWRLKLLRAINKEWVTFQHIIVCEHAK